MHRAVRGATSQAGDVSEEGQRVADAVADLPVALQHRVGARCVHRTDSNDDHHRGTAHQQPQAGQVPVPLHKRMKYTE